MIGLSKVLVAWASFLCPPLNPLIFSHKSDCGKNMACNGKKVGLLFGKRWCSFPKKQAYFFPLRRFCQDDSIIMNLSKHPCHVYSYDVIV